MDENVFLYTSHSTTGLFPADSSTRIPQELVDLIIDYSYLDKPTLAACGLVCQAWVAPSRYHLFSTVYLSRNALTFCELLDSPSATIQPFVRNLEIVRKYGMSREWINLVIPRLGGLSAVTSLRLCLSQKLSEQALASLQSTFRMLVKLDISSVEFVAFDGAVGLICSFPFLEILVFHQLEYWLNTSLPAPGKYTLSRHLHTLDTSRPGVVLEWFLSRDPVPTVSRLYLSSVAPSTFPCIAKYLRTIGHALRYLAFNFNMYPVFPEDADAILHFSRYVDLIHNPELRFIRVQSSSPKVVEFVIAIFSQINTSCLEEFRLCIRRNRGGGSIRHQPWAALDHVAMRPQLSRLQKVRIDVYSGMGTFLKKSLPACHERGILQIIET